MGETQQNEDLKGWPWMLWIIGICCVLTMGMLGFRIHFRSVPGCGGATWLDCIYGTIRLFALEFDGSWDGPKPLMLEISRFGAPFLLAVGAATVALVLFRKQVDVLRLRFTEQHAVVCGGGGNCERLVHDLVEHGQRVVVIKENASSSARSALRSQGAICIEGDARDLRTLTTANLKHASSVLAMTESDHGNLAIALAAAGLSEKRPSELGKLVVLVHIGDPILRDLLQRNLILTPTGTTPFVVRFFNHFQNAARAIFQKHPLEVLGDDITVASEVHLILPDLGKYEQALALQAARIGHFRNGKKTNLHIFTPDASAKLKHVETHYPNLRLCCNLSTEEAPQASDFVACVARLGLSLPAEAAMTVFTPRGDEQHALLVALRLAESLRNMKGHFRIHLHARTDSPLVDIVRQNDSLRSAVTVPSDDHVTCGWKAVFGEEQDRLAKAIHEAWYLCEGERLARDPSAVKKPTFRRWEDLTEEQKDSSRSQADSLPVKLRATGSTPATAKTDWPRIVADNELVEDLARMEHARWCAVTWLAGWTYSTQRSDVNKTHDNLVPYSELADHIKQHDRDAILNIQDYLTLMNGPLVAHFCRPSTLHDPIRTETSAKEVYERHP